MPNNKYRGNGIFGKSSMDAKTTEWEFDKRGNSLKISPHKWLINYKGKV